MLPKPVSDLIDAFSLLPGVGPKTAARLTFHLLRAPEKHSIQLADALRTLFDETIFCGTCGNITVDDPCNICRDVTRERGLIAVVEEPLDVLAFERANVYRGLYHVLHGVISPLNGIGPEDLRIGELLARLDRGGVQEVIMATNPGMEGDATAMYIQGAVSEYGVKVTSLARGLPTGGDIEYADPLTLMRALQDRNAV